MTRPTGFLLGALLLLPAAALAAPQDDEGWIEFDEGGEGEDGWIEFEDEGEKAPPPPPPPMEEGETTEGEEGEAREPPPPPPPPKEVVSFDLDQCPVIDLNQVPAGRERVILLPLLDKAELPDDTAALTDTVATRLSEVPGYEYPPVEPLPEGVTEVPFDWQPPAPVATGEPRFEVIDGRCLQGKVSEEVWDEVESCERSTCMEGIAAATRAAWIVYGSLQKPGEAGLLVELKLYRSDKGRIINRAVAEAPIAKALAVSVASLLKELIPLPDPPGPPRPRPPEPSLLESPIFIGGATVALAGTVAFGGALAYLIEAERVMWVPEVHRDLKAQARVTWPWAAGVAAVAPLVIAAGVAAMAVSPFLLPSPEAPEEAEEGQP